jgi:hypothetical protein
MKKQVIAFAIIVASLTIAAVAVMLYSAQQNEKLQTLSAKCDNWCSNNKWYSGYYNATDTYCWCTQIFHFNKPKYYRQANVSEIG